MSVQSLVLIIAGVLAVYGIFESRARSAVAWGLLLVVIVELAVRLD